MHREKPQYQSKTYMDLSARYLMNTYARQPIVLERGEGSYVWDTDGRRYLDFINREYSASGMDLTARIHEHGERNRLVL